MTLLCRRVVNEDEGMDDDDNNNNNRLRFSYLSSVRVFLSFFFSLFCVCVCLFVCVWWLAPLETKTKTVIAVIWMKIR